MPKVAAFFDLFFKGETYERQAELISECGYKYAETWKGANADELKAMAARDVKLVSVLVNGVTTKEYFPNDVNTRDAFIERVDKIADNALAVGCKQAIVTAGCQLNRKSYQEQRAVLVETLAKTGEMLVGCAPELADNYVNYTQAAVDSVLTGFGGQFVSIALIFFVFTTVMRT